MEHKNSQLLNDLNRDNFADNRRFNCSKKSLDPAKFLYNFMRKARLSGVRTPITIVHIRKLYKFIRMPFDSHSF